MQPPVHERASRREEGPPARVLHSRSLRATRFARRSGAVDAALLVELVDAPLVEGDQVAGGAARRLDGLGEHLGDLDVGDEGHAVVDGEAADPNLTRAFLVADVAIECSTPTRASAELETPRASSALRRKALARAAGEVGRDAKPKSEPTAPSFPSSADISLSSSSFYVFTQKGFETELTIQLISRQWPTH